MPTAATRLARAMARAWVGAGLALVAALVAIRWLRYASWTSEPRLDALFGELMVFDVQTFVWPWVYTTLKLEVLAVAAAVLLAGLHRRLGRHLVTRAGGAVALTPLAAALLVTVLLWLHYLLDLNVTMARVAASSLVALALTTPARVARRLPAGLVAVGWGAFFVAWLVAAGDFAERVAIGAWAVVVALAAGALASRVRRRDVALLCLAALVPVNVLTTVLPLALAWHGGTWMGAGLGYNFCEVAGGDTVWATVPVCDSVRAGFEDCRLGAIVEYDRATKEPVRVHRYFSPDFHGRLELIECLPDEIHVAVQAAVIRGEPVVHGTLAFPVADPTVFDPAIAGPGVGITIAYDRAHEAVFYSAEFSHRIVRLDRATGRREDVAAEALARRWVNPVTLETHSGSNLLYTGSIHPGRNRLYAVEWLQGRQAVAIDLDTRRVAARYDVNGGGALGLAVDAERDRLVVSSLWGIEVFDLAADALVLRRRMGFGNRSAVIDRGRGRIYVGSTVDGRIRVLDRDSYALLGQIPIGIGTRFARLSLDGSTLYGSSAAAHYFWSDATLGPRLD